MTKHFIHMALLLLISGGVHAAPKAKPEGKAKPKAEAKKEAVPAVTRGVGVCSSVERWELGQDVLDAVSAPSLQEFSATAKDKTPVRGFSEGLLLREEKSEVARALGEYWMGRALYLAGLFGPAITQFNQLLAKAPSPRTAAFQIAAMECLRTIHAKYPVSVLSSDAMANLSNFFKDGLVVDRRNALFDMGLELVMRRISEKASSDSVESAIKLLKGSGPYEDYARAIWAASRGKLEAATGSLKRLADAKDLPASIEERRNEIRLLLGRAFYEDKKYREASQYLDVVDKRSNIFVHALTQQSWVDLARNEHRRVVGTVMAIQSTGLRATFAPETYMTAAMALNEFCLFPEALRILSNFKRNYGPAYHWLDRNTGKGAKGELYPEAIAHLTKQPSGVPLQVASEWIRSPIFLNNQRAINSSFQQEKTVSGHIKSAEAYAASEAAKLEALRRKVVLREANEIAKEAARKFSAAEFSAKDLAKKAVASQKGLEDAKRDAVHASSVAEQHAKMAGEAPGISQRTSDDAKVVAKQAAEAKAALTAAESAEAQARASVMPAKMAAQIADDRASASERFARVLDMSAREAERKRQLAFLPLQKWEAKTAKASAEAESTAKKATEAKRVLAVLETEHAEAKAVAAKAREEAAAAAMAMRESLKKGPANGQADAAFEKAWDKARSDKAAADERLRKAKLAYEAFDKQLASAEAAVSRTTLASQTSARIAANARMRAMRAAGSNGFDAFEKGLAAVSEANAADARAREDAKAMAKATADYDALKAGAEAEKRKLVEYETVTRDIEATLAELKKSAGDARNAKKIAATTEAAAKKAATVAQAAASKAATARQLSAKLDREAAASAKVAAASQASFQKISESARPTEKVATQARLEAEEALTESRRVRALADEAKARYAKVEPLVLSRAKVTLAKSEASANLELQSQRASKRAQEAQANIAIAAATAKASAEKAAEGKAKVAAAEQALTNAKKEAAEAKEKATALSAVSKECTKYAAAVQKAGGKPGAVTKPEVAVLESPSPEMLQLNELLKLTEARQAQLAKSLAAWVQTLKQFREGAARQRDRLLARIETTFRGLNERMLRQLQAVAKANDLVEAEIWHGAGKDMVWQNANPEYAAAVKDGKFQKRAPASDGGYDWGTTTLSQNGKREVWDDEVGNAQAVLIDNCSNKDKYAGLRKK